jgi:hypothetical protein
VGSAGSLAIEPGTTVRMASAKSIDASMGRSRLSAVLPVRSSSHPAPQSRRLAAGAPSICVPRRAACRRCRSRTAATPRLALR